MFVLAVAQIGVCPVLGVAVIWVLKTKSGLDRARSSGESAVEHQAGAVDEAGFLTCKTGWQPRHPHGI
jgi:hypothetical protein